ncbi:MAG: GntR family transcriptional regulator [Acidobacteriota bacterium]
MIQGLETSPEAPASILRVIERRSLREIAVEQIRVAVEHGELKAGERLTELGFARRLGVAQATIREALMELEHQGFVERNGPRETRITVLTRRQINDIYVVRTRLEMLAVELLVARERADLTGAETQYEKMLGASRVEQHAEFYRADLDFHRALWRATGNASLAEALERLAPKLFAFVIIRHARATREKLVATAETHGTLLALIRSRELTAATELMEASMERAWIDDAELPE